MNSIKLSRFLLVLTVLALSALPAAGQDASTQIKGEIARLQKSLKERPVTDPRFADLNSAIDNSLKNAAEAVRRGRLYWGLQELGAAEDFLQGVRMVMEKADAVKSGLPAFEAEWREASEESMALAHEAGQQDWKTAPAAVRALSEVAQGKAIPLLEGGRGFAVASHPKDGLYYVGTAEGSAKFAKFCASLKFAETREPLALRSLLPELQSLQEKTNAAFQPPRSIELHSLFIQLNSTLKQAKELDDSRSYAGALLQYLEAVGDYAMLSAAPVDAASQATLKKSLAAARKRLDISHHDDSLALLFLERAESQIARADGSPQSADAWKSASVILEQVLPAYFATLSNPAAPLQQASAKTVDITLVRWPYT